MRKYHSVKRAKYLKEVLRLYYEEGYGVSEIARVFPIGSTTVSNWIRTFACENHHTKEAMKKESANESIARPSMDESAEALKRRIKELEKQLSEAEKSAEAYKEGPEAVKRRVKELEKQLSNAEMRAEAYKTMIEVAESMGMPVRKKAIAKR